jgi:hypothetical protein
VISKSHAVDNDAFHAVYARPSVRLSGWHCEHGTACQNSLGCVEPTLSALSAWGQTVLVATKDLADIAHEAASGRSGRWDALGRLRLPLRISGRTGRNLWARFTRKLKTPDGSSDPAFQPLAI